MGNGKTEFDSNGRQGILTALPALTFCVATVIVMSACGSSAVSDNGASNTAPQSGTRSDANGVNIPDVNQPTLAANGQNIEVVSQANRMMQRIEEMRANAANQKPSKVPASTRPAPEDSVMSTQLTDMAREIRTWKKNPVLLRVEKSYGGDSTMIKVVLRDGRVFDLDGKSIANLDQITSVAVLQLVGVTPPNLDGSKSRTRPDSTSVKKSEN